jgi:hypothetical protein
VYLLGSRGRLLDGLANRSGCGERGNRGRCGNHLACGDGRGLDHGRGLLYDLLFLLLFLLFLGRSRQCIFPHLFWQL